MGEQLETPIVGKKVKTVLSSKFCTGRHLQLFNETKKLLEEVEDDDGGVSAKRRKTEKTSKPYQGKCRKLADYRDDVRILKKLSMIYPDILDISKVMFLSSDPQNSRYALQKL